MIISHGHLDNDRGIGAASDAGSVDHVFEGAVSSSVKPVNKVQNDLYFDAINLIRGEKSGNMSKYAFRDARCDGDPAGGIAFWSELVKNPEFPANKEMALFQNDEILKIIPMGMPRPVKKVSVVEIGPGLAESVKGKTFKVLDTFKRHAPDIKLANYTAIDIAPSLAKEAADAASERFKKHYDIQGDFLNMPPLSDLDGVPLALIWGGTLWNAHSIRGMQNDLILANQLKAIGKMLTSPKNPEAYIAFTYFGEKTADEWKRIYNDPNNIKTVESILYTMAANPDIRMDPKSFETRIEYNTAEKLLTMEVESKLDQKIRFGNSSEPMHLQKGERRVLVNAYRPNERDIESIAAKANCAVVKQGYDKSCETGLFVLKYALDAKPQ